MGNRKIQALEELLLQLPPDLNKIESFVKQECFSTEELSIAMITLVEEYMHEDCDILNLEINTNITQKQLEQCHCYYLYQITELLLNYGFDPNYIWRWDGYTENNFTNAITHIGIPYVAADVMQLILDHGADIDMIIDGEGIYSRVNYDVSFSAYEDNQPNRKRYDALVHLWFVMIASKGQSDATIEPVNGFDIKNLKNHRNYDFCLINVPNSCGDRWSMRIYDKYTRWEVIIF